MICLRSQLSLKQDVTVKTIWSVICDWKKDSRFMPEDLRSWMLSTDISTLGQDPVEKSAGSFKITLFSFSPRILGFRLEEEGGAYITTICFNADHADVQFSFEMEVPDASQSFRKPKIFESLVPYLAEGRYSKKALVEGNYGRMAEIINGDQRMHLPVVYISTNVAERYEVNPDSVAEKLFGVAQVYAEPNHSYSKNLRERTQNKSARNGTVGIYCDKYRTYISVGLLQTEPLSKIDFFHKVSQLSAMNEIDEELSWNGLIRKKLTQNSKVIHDRTLEITETISKLASTMMLENFAATMQVLKAKSNEAKLSGRIDELTKQIDELTRQIDDLQKSSEIRDEKIKSLEEELCAKDAIIQASEDALAAKKKEFDEFVYAFDTDAQKEEEAQEKIAQLTEANANLSAQLEIFKSVQNKKSCGGIDLHVDMELEPAFETEFTDFLKSILWTLCSQYERLQDTKGVVFNKRLYYVLKDMHEKNPGFDPARSETTALQAKIEKAFRSHGTQGEDVALDLKNNCGFLEKEFKQGHHKLYLGNENCSVTVASSPKNAQSLENTLHDALNSTLLVKKINIQL